MRSRMSLSEIEDLGYYDFMAYMNVPFFNIGGNPSLDLLAERCNLGPGSHVLDVGCGTGGNSVHISEKFGCRVTGIDISEFFLQLIQVSFRKALFAVPGSGVYTNIEVPLFITADGTFLETILIAGLFMLPPFILDVGFHFHKVFTLFLA